MRIEIHIITGRSPSVQKLAAAKWLILAFENDKIVSQKEGIVTIVDCTNKKAALVALRDALKRFNKAAVIKLYIVDPFVRNMLMTNMPRRWADHDWKRFRYNREIRYKELWEEINGLLKNHAVSYASKEELKNLDKEIRKWREQELVNFVVSP